MEIPVIHRHPTVGGIAEIHHFGLAQLLNLYRRLIKSHRGTMPRRAQFFHVAAITLFQEFPEPLLRRR
ncbi:hypothetical protein SDC9_173329 [bioreactor metagenome]|uniref:Uncharacterized protein n=1 Tax=bioreactor metagenome TaxID=1076179 RepID=A0A645GG69_9ZZZZ